MSDKTIPENGDESERSQKTTDNKNEQHLTVVQETRAAIEKEQKPNGSTNIPPTILQKSKRSTDSRRMCRMFFPSSGHRGFDVIKDSEEFPPIETLREMILFETRLRLSNPIQELMDYYHQDEDSVTLIHDLIQEHVVQSFGYKDVNALRTAFHRFPDDPVVRNAFYIKHNKVTQGLIDCGQSVQDISLLTIDGHSTNLFSFIPSKQPLVILAGSTS